MSVRTTKQMANGRRPHRAAASAETSEGLIRTIASFAGEAVDALVAFVVSQFAVGQAAFVNAAKAMIEIDQRGEDSAALLRAAGVSASTIANARYLVRAYEMVRRGLIDESVFDTLTYRDAYHLVRLADRNSGFLSLHQKGWLSLGSDEWESLYDHGCTVAEWEQREADRRAREEAARKPAPAAAAPVPAPAAETASAPAEPAASASTTVSTPAAPAAASTPAPASEPAKPASSTSSAPAATKATPSASAEASDKPTIAKFTMLCDAVQKMAEDLILDDPSQLEAVHTRIMQLAQAVNKAAEAVSEIQAKAA